MDEDQEIEQQELQKKKKHRKIVNGILIAVLILIVVGIPLGICIYNWVCDVLNINQRVLRKPVIYLYPPQETQVSVYIDTDLAVTYPEYNGGWNVTALPDGTRCTPPTAGNTATCSGRGFPTRNGTSPRASA